MGAIRNNSTRGARTITLIGTLALAALLASPAQAMMKTTPGGKNKCGPDGCGGGPGGQTPGKLWVDVGKGAGAPFKAYKPVKVFTVDGKPFCHYPPSIVPAPCPWREWPELLANRA